MSPAAGETLGETFMEAVGHVGAIGAALTFGVPTLSL